MQLAELMAGGALAISLVSLCFSLQAAWPQIKPWAEDLRDTVLWMALLAVIAGAGWLGWKQYEAGRQPHDDARPVSHVDSSRR